jgi:hypothetical protein
MEQRKWMKQTAAAVVWAGTLKARLKATGNRRPIGFGRPATTTGRQGIGSLDGCFEPTRVCVSDVTRAHTA